MAVTIDHVPLAAAELGLQTLGQVLSHIRRSNRLVTQVLINGRAPIAADLPTLRQTELEASAVEIETAETAVMVQDAVRQLRTALDDADVQREKAVSALQLGDAVMAMKQLGPCFVTWQHAHGAVVDLAQLANVDASALEIDGVPFDQRVNAFADQLREVKTAIERRDYVMLADVLAYDVPETLAAWRQMIDRMA